MLCAGLAKDVDALIITRSSCYPGVVVQVIRHYTDMVDVQVRDTACAGTSKQEQYYTITSIP